MPPPPFLAEPGEPPIPFGEWYVLFEQYLVAKGGESYSDTRKKTILLNALGVEGQRQYASLPSDPLRNPIPERHPTPLFETTVRRLSERFAERKFKTVARAEFLARGQEAGESVAAYIAELRRLAAKGRYAEYSEDQAVLDQFIARTTFPDIKETPTRGR